MNLEDITIKSETQSLGQFELICTYLEKYGVLKLNEYLTKEECHNLHGEYLRILSSEKTESIALTPYSYGDCARVKLPKLNTLEFPKTCEVFSSAFMEEVATRYYAGNEFNLNEEVFVVKDVVGSKHIANDLHYDVRKILKFFLYLTDTKKENGAFTCVPGSHLYTKKYREVYKDKICYENRHLTRELDAKKSKEKIPIEGKAGTLIIFDTDVWHQAGLVSNGTRKVMRGHTRLASQSNQNLSLLKRIREKLKP